MVQLPLRLLRCWCQFFPQEKGLVRVNYGQNSLHNRIGSADLSDPTKKNSTEEEYQRNKFVFLIVQKTPVISGLTILC